MSQYIDPKLLQIAMANLDKLPLEIQQKIGELVAYARKNKVQDKAQDDFMAFVNYVWPNFIHGRHHERMARAFEKVARGECKRLIINMPPRHSKSEMASYLLPAWFLGKFPAKKIIQASYNTELAIGFGRKVRNLVGSDVYRDIFPNVELRADSKAAGRWNTNHNGDYFAAGVGANLAGRGADICLGESTKIVIDDNGVEKQIDLKDVKIGDKIKTINGWERVTRKKLTIHEKFVKINNDIEASTEHRFLTDKGWKTAGELKLNDRILTKTIWSLIWNRVLKLKNTLLKTQQKILAKYDEQVL